MQQDACREAGSVIVCFLGHLVLVLEKLKTPWLIDRGMEVSIQSGYFYVTTIDKTRASSIFSRTRKDALYVYCMYSASYLVLHKMEEALVLSIVVT